MRANKNKKKVSWLPNQDNESSCSLGGCRSWNIVFVQSNSSCEQQEWELHVGTRGLLSEQTWRGLGN